MLQSSKRGGGLIGVLLGGLLFGLIGGLLFGLLVGLIVGLIGGLLGGLLFGLLFGLLGGLVTDSVSKRSGANAGLRQSAVYAGRYFAMVLPLAGLLAWAGAYASGEFQNVLEAAATLMASWVAPMLGLYKGGFFVIKNLAMRYLIARSGRAPWRHTTFLRYSVKQVLMIQQGGSFRFIHRMLLEHLAAQAEPPVRVEAE